MRQSIDVGYIERRALIAPHGDLGGDRCFGGNRDETAETGIPRLPDPFQFAVGLPSRQERVTCRALDGMGNGTPCTRRILQDDDIVAAKCV